MKFQGIFNRKCEHKEEDGNQCRKKKSDSEKSEGSQKYKKHLSF